MIRLHHLFILFFVLIINGCKSKIKAIEDSMYSRHLQRHVKLSILNTPVPDDKNDFNLLIVNDGQDIEQLHVKEVVDSLYNKKIINPLIVVAIHTGNRLKELGIADYPDYKNNGRDAAKYSAFINNELYFFIKKKTGVRKFNSITIAGCSLGGLSAFDVAWDHGDRIDKAGIFSGSFWYRDKDVADAGYTDDGNRIMLNKIRSSKKKPHLKLWFYAGGQEETNDRDKDGVIDVIDDTKDLVTLIKSKIIAPDYDIVYTEIKQGKHNYASWSQIFPAFLIWAVGK